MMTKDDDYVMGPPLSRRERAQTQRYHDYDHDHRHHHQTGVSRKRFEQTAGTRLVVGYACTTC